MILVVDVGNTNITFGVYDRKSLVTTFRLMAKTQRTSDEYGVLITELCQKSCQYESDRGRHYSKRRAKRHARAHWRH